MKRYKNTAEQQKTSSRRNLLDNTLIKKTKKQKNKRETTVYKTPDRYT